MFNSCMVLMFAGMCISVIGSDSLMDRVVIFCVCVCVCVHVSL